MATTSDYLSRLRDDLRSRESFSFIPDRDVPPPPAAPAEVGGGPRVVYVGFPSDFSLAFLLGLLECDVTVAGIVTSPGAHPAILGDNALSRIAGHIGVPLIRAWRINDVHSRQDLAGLRPDACVMASFDQIVHPPTLAIAPGGWLNVHPSLLPQYRGPEPIYWAIADGCERTGITLHRAVPRVDAGPVLAQAEIALDEHETAGTLTRRLAEAGVALLGDAVARLLAGDPGRPLGGDGSYRPSVGHRHLDDAPSAKVAERLVRAGTPDMPAWTDLGEGPVYVTGARLGSPGAGPVLRFPDGPLELTSTMRRCGCHHDLEDCPHREP